MHPRSSLRRCRLRLFFVQTDSHWRMFWFVWKIAKKKSCFPENRSYLYTHHSALLRREVPKKMKISHFWSRFNPRRRTSAKHAPSRRLEQRTWTPFAGGNQPTFWQRRLWVSNVSIQRIFCVFVNSCHQLLQNIKMKGLKKSIVNYWDSQYCYFF